MSRTAAPASAHSRSNPMTWSVSSRSRLAVGSSATITDGFPASAPAMGHALRHAARQFVRVAVQGRRFESDAKCQGIASVIAAECVDRLL